MVLSLALSFSIGTLASFTGCSGRKRTNPLDPENPQTEGRPIGLRILSDGNRVQLSWDRVEIPGITGYQVYRKAVHEASAVTAGLVRGNLPEFSESGLPMGVRQDYWVQACHESGYMSPLSDSVTIIPGPYNFWVVDVYLGQLFRLTYDGMHVLARSHEALWAVSMAVDPAHGRIYAVDYIPGRVIQMSVSGEMLRIYEGFERPSLLAIDPEAGEIWVAEGAGTRITRLDTLGNGIGSFTGFSHIRDMAWSGQRGRFWIADNVDRKIGLYSADGGWVFSADAYSSQYCRIACDTDDRYMLACDSLWLRRMACGGESETFGPYPGLPADVAVNPDNEGIWVLIADLLTANTELFSLDPSGGVRFGAGEFLSARGLAADPFGGGCLVSDTGRHRMVRVDAAGRIMGVMEGLDSPREVYVE